MRAMSDLVSLKLGELPPTTLRAAEGDWSLNSLNLSGHKSKQLEKQLKVVESSCSLHTQV